MNLAMLYEDNNHYDEAHRCLDAVLRTDPNHSRARLYMKDVESAAVDVLRRGFGSARRPPQRHTGYSHYRF